MWVLGLWARFKVWVIIALGVLATLVSAYVKGRSDEKHRTESKRLKDRLEDIIETEKVRDKVREMDEPALDRELSKWMRNDKR